MSELFTSGSVGGGAGNRPFYPALDSPSAPVSGAKNANFGYNKIVENCKSRRASYAIVGQLGRIQPKDSVCGKRKRTNLFHQIQFSG